MRLPEPARSPFTGQEWIGRFMQAQANLQAEQFFLLFTLGQIGAAGEYDPPAALDMLAAVEIDARDVVEAAEQLAEVAREIAANAKRNAVARVAAEEPRE